MTHACKVLFVSIAVVLGVVTPAAADGTAPRTTRSALVGPDANLNCSDLSPAAGEDASQPGPGAVRFKQYTSGTVQVTVRLNGAAPNTTYFVRVIQGGDGTCQGTGSTVVTDDKGRATLTIFHEPVEGHAALQVIVEVDGSGEPPYYRAAERYWLQ